MDLPSEASVVPDDLIAACVVLMGVQASLKHFTFLLRSGSPVTNQVTTPSDDGRRSQPQPDTVIGLTSRYRT
jgi:hypothetical protein